MVIDTISNDEYDYIFCFGQKPLLTDKVTIEITAKEGNFYIDTPFAYDADKNISDIDMFFAGILKVISKYDKI